MLRYTIRRVVLLVPQLFAVVVGTFILVVLTPGNPARAQLGSQAPQAAVDQLAKQLGYGGSVVHRFWLYLNHLVHGNLGQSWVSGDAVAHDLIERAPYTLELITVGFVGALLIAIPLGVAGARASGFLGRATDGVSFGYGLMAGAIPDFWFALIMIFVFYSVFQVAPAPIGQLDISVPAPAHITGAVGVDALLTGDWSAFVNHLGHLALPVVTLVFINAAPILRMTRNSVGETLRSSSITFARANGLPRSLITRYALRNALLPIVTVAGVLYTILIAGAVLTETIFSWGGIGQYAVQSVQNEDWAALQGVVLVAAAFSLVAYLAIDLIHAAIDPRVRG